MDVRTVENGPLDVVLPLTEPERDAVSRFSEGAGLLAFVGSGGSSRDSPGSPLLPDAKLSPEPDSSLLLLYAAFPSPLSAVCLNHEGSRDPKEAAIWSREGSTSDAAVLLVLLVGLLVSGCTIDFGLLPPPLELGRCCHDSVPERARLDAVFEDCDVEEADDSARAGVAVSAEEFRDPKPLNSGMSLVGDSGGGSIATEGAIDSGRLTSTDVSNGLMDGMFAFSGLIDLARSANRCYSRPVSSKQTTSKLTSSARRPLPSALRNFFLQLPIPLGVFSFPILR